MHGVGGGGGGGGGVANRNHLNIQWDHKKRAVGVAILERNSRDRSSLGWQETLA